MICKYPLLRFGYISYTAKERKNHVKNVC
jgi:hypothetical protein